MTLQHFSYLEGIVLFFPNSVWYLVLPSFMMRVYYWRENRADPITLEGTQ